jgi:hypothetical protein
MQRQYIITSLVQQPVIVVDGDQLGGAAAGEGEAVVPGVSQPELGHPAQGPRGVPQLLHGPGEGLRGGVPVVLGGLGPGQLSPGEVRSTGDCSRPKEAQGLRPAGQYSASGEATGQQ